MLSKANWVIEQQIARYFSWLSAVRKIGLLTRSVSMNGNEEADADADADDRCPVVSIQSRFDISRFDTNRSQFVTHVK